MIEAEFGLTPTGRRSYPLSYRVEFLRRWDECVERGAKARLMRENNMDRATGQAWLKARDRGEFTAAMVTAAEKSRSPRMNSRERAEVAKLRAENERLKEKVVQAEAAQQILGKAFELLQGITERSTEDMTEIPPALMSASEYAQRLERRKLS
ncbi:hypothetical protein R1CP_39080 (plasmid) [Rhodococcus opacus]|uniref:Transposase n=1 Tax=Rhodococcus opacus TaxID=37919 RepID=A0A1B1KIK9_RHOOP|nr:hypothetical protein [Rhodococcus opacus]ANS32308.1 hypothetical protein R1CP_38575 [Rhodococcus opacus]ANS32400.1 hypothetical protein R1CP_39080 [Rhodococcus opacus]